MQKRDEAGGGDFAILMTARGSSTFSTNRYFRRDHEAVASPQTFCTCLKCFGEEIKEDKMSVSSSVTVVLY